MAARDPADIVSGPLVGRDVHFLHPGEVYVSGRGGIVSTILGSCVAVLLFDAHARVGGVNHFLLPLWASGTCATRFGNVAMATLLDDLLRAGLDRSRAQAKIFGGASILPGLRRDERHLGEKNVDVARAFLAEQRIPVAASDVLGDRGRKVVFRLGDGSVWVRTL